MSRRQYLVAGNWKMHGSRQFVEKLLQAINRSADQIPNSVDVVVCPSSIHLALAAQLLEDTEIGLGAQNVSAQPEGAVTGELAASMLPDYGIQYVIVGHSERRQQFDESNTEVAQKFSAVQEQKLTPILCLGETLQQREAGETDKIVLEQLKAVVDLAGIGAIAQAVIAYEPIWAIGTGRTATPEQAQEVHRAIREFLAQLDVNVAENVRILYGGSVKAANANELFAQADIDGGLVGGASLKAEEFISICKSVD